MILSASLACEDLRKRISDVRNKPYVSGHAEIFFRVDGILHVGKMKGRNQDLILGHGIESDGAIALRILLDGDSEIQNPKKELLGEMF